MRSALPGRPREQPGAELQLMRRHAVERPAQHHRRDSAEGLQGVQQAAGRPGRMRGWCEAHLCRPGVGAAVFALIVMRSCC